VVDSATLIWGERSLAWRRLRHTGGPMSPGCYHQASLHLLCAHQNASGEPRGKFAPAVPLAAEQAHRHTAAACEQARQKLLTGARGLSFCVFDACTAWGRPQPTRALAVTPELRAYSLFIYWVYGHPPKFSDSLLQQSRLRGGRRERDERLCSSTPDNGAAVE
jgi:hypothetical protein